MPLSVVATFRIATRTALVIARGAVTDFQPNCPNSAIVNAANEGCLGGGGVDGAISNAGGEELLKARLALPIVEGDNVRCTTGDAKLTGPNRFGELKTDYVIHAVGPNYHYFQEEEYEKADSLLKSAYINSLEIARKEGLKHVAFSLLSAGVFKGKRSLEEVLRLGVESINEWASLKHENNSVESVVMCGFMEIEADLLLGIGQDMGLEPIEEFCMDGLQS